MSVTLQTRPGRLDFFVRGEQFATYRYDEAGAPGFSALLAAGGRAITPPEEETDGPALCLAHGSVNGVAFPAAPVSTEAAQNVPTGRIVTTEMVARRGAYSVGFRQTCAWIGPEGMPMLTDVRTARIAPGPGDGRILDLALQLRAPEDRPVTLGRTETALLLLRLATPLCPSGGGQLRNSVGDYGPAQMHGRSAAWCAGVGVVRGETIGFALLDHPDNPWHPSPWLVLENGTLSPSPFAWRTQELPPGGALSLRYRLHVYSGYVEAGWADARLAEFTHARHA
ncbi:MAG TPA: DUF6807 family protein [Chthonomonadaceae bacterium]|nr:DUF6807 family protein [Chthonomonadaceae bacterium]